MASLKWVHGKFKLLPPIPMNATLCFVAKLPIYLQKSASSDEMYLIAPIDDSGIILCTKDRATLLVNILKAVNSKGKEVPQEVPSDLVEDIELRVKAQLGDIIALRPWIFYEKVESPAEEVPFVFSEKKEVSSVKQVALKLETAPIVIPTSAPEENKSLKQELAETVLVVEEDNFEF
jgi:hypothetical protein